LLASTEPASNADWRLASAELAENANSERVNIKPTRMQAGTVSCSEFELNFSRSTANLSANLLLTKKMQDVCIVKLELRYGRFVKEDLLLNHENDLQCHCYISKTLHHYTNAFCNAFRNSNQISTTNTADLDDR
jgi:hypothetical protein